MTCTATRAGQVIIADKNYYGHDFEAALAAAGLVLLRPARKGEPERRGRQFFKPLRQIIESVNDTFKGQLDLERHGGHTAPGVLARILQRILALNRRHLAQRPRQPTHHALADRLRPLTPQRGARADVRWRPTFDPPGPCCATRRDRPSHVLRGDEYVHHRHRP
jgi:hypothetical protein